MRVLSFALRALRREARAGDLLTLAAALTLAVAVMTAVGTLVNRVSEAVAANAAEIVGGDFGLTGRQPIDPRLETAARARGLRTARMIGFPSVLFRGQASQLAEIKAVDAGYPLRGRLLASADLAGLAPEAVRPPAPGEAYADARLLDALGIAPGDRLEFGAGTLRVVRRLHAEPDAGSDLFQLAPRLLVNLADVEGTGLLGPGSRAQHRLLVAGPAGAVDAFRADLRGRLREAARDLRPLSIQNTQQAVRGAFERAQRFGSLAALLTLLLAGVAMALAANRFALRRVDQVAILRCLGAPQRGILAALALQLLGLAIPASVLGIGLGLLAQAGLVQVLGSLLPDRLPLPQAEPALAGAGIGLVLLLGFGLPPLLRLRGVPPMRVLNRSFAALPPLSALAYLAALAATVALVLLASGDLRLGTIVLGGLAGLALAAGLAGLVLLRLLRILQAPARGPWRLGLAALARRRGLSLTQAVGLSLSLCALLLLSAIGPALLAQWRARMPEDTPNYFLLNVQQEQAAAVRQALLEIGVSRPRLEPFASGRLLAVNGRPPHERWRQNEAEREVESAADRSVDRNRAHRQAADAETGEGFDRPLNLSWRREFPPANTLVAGEFWRPDSQRAEASIESGWAQRMGIRLGDRLTLRVGERDFEVEVSNLRKADWDSFRVNFFVLLNAGAVEKAPHSLISSFYLPPGQSARLAELSRRFPNLSLLDVQAILARVRGVIERVGQAVQGVLAFSLAAGVLVLLAAMQASAGERRLEGAVLRTLGARRAQLRAAVLAEFAALGGLAAVLAVGGATLIGLALAERMFQMRLAIPWPALAGGGGLGVALTMLAGWAGTRRVLRTPPVQALRAE